MWYVCVYITTANELVGTPEHSESRHAWHMAFRQASCNNMHESINAVEKSKALTYAFPQNAPSLGQRWERPSGSVHQKRVVVEVVVVVVVYVVCANIFTA